jgi:hypothetical protein
MKYLPILSSTLCKNSNRAELVPNNTRVTPLRRVCAYYLRSTSKRPCLRYIARVCEADVFRVIEESNSQVIGTDQDTSCGCPCSSITDSIRFDHTKYQANRLLDTFSSASLIARIMMPLKPTNLLVHRAPHLHSRSNGRSTWRIRRCR